MDIALIMGGLGLLGYLVNNQDKKYDTDDIYDKHFDDTNTVKIQKYNTSNDDIYINKSMVQLQTPYDTKKNELYHDSIHPDSNLVNRIWRLLNNKERNKKINDDVNKSVNKDLQNLKDLKNVKNIKHNNIESMMNINNNSNPNGSLENIAGILNLKKNILGMMPHPERMVDEIISNKDGINLFTSLLN